MWTRRKGNREQRRIRREDTRKRDAAAEQNHPNFGAKIIDTIYKTLFPYINSQNTNLCKLLRDNCFENGAFVFKDENQILFKLLIDGFDHYGLGTIKAKSHLIPRRFFVKSRLDERDIWSAYKDIKIFFYNSVGNPEPEEGISLITRSRFRDRFRNVKQYERRITTRIDDDGRGRGIKYLCNWECRRNPAINYCNTVGKKEKKVIKFYCYKIQYIYPKLPPREEGPYTYVKTESGAITKAAGADTMSKGRHLSINLTKKASKNRNERAAIVAFRDNQCYKKKETDVYCYRAEDYGWLRREDDNIRKFSRHHNQFPGALTELEFLNSAVSEIHNYSKRDLADNARNPRYKLRTGNEMYVPQILTTKIITNFQNLQRGDWDYNTIAGANPQCRPAGGAEGGGDGGDGDGRGGGHRKRRRTRKRRRRKKRKTRKKKN